MVHGFFYHTNTRKKPEPKFDFGKDRFPPAKRTTGDFVTIRTVRNGECRWAYGEPSEEMVMCGREIMRGSFCAEHDKQKKARNQQVRDEPG